MCKLKKQVSISLRDVRYGEEPIFFDIYYTFRSPQIFPCYNEIKVTNGLGYKPVGYHEDSEKGLIRHLGEMDKRVRDNMWGFQEMTRTELLGGFLALEDALMDLKKTYVADMRELSIHAVSGYRELARLAKEGARLAKEGLSLSNKPGAKESQAPKKGKGLIARIIDRYR